MFQLDAIVLLQRGILLLLFTAEEEINMRKCHNNNGLS